MRSAEPEGLQADRRGAHGTGLRRARRLAAAIGLLLGLPVAAAADCVFVNINSFANAVAAFSVASDGSLIPVSGSPFATGGSGGFTAAVGSAGLCAGSGLLYVTNSLSNDVSGFSISSGCRLTSVPGSPFPAGLTPVGVEPDPAGSHLYIANFDGDDVTVYSIADDGSLTPIVDSPFPAATTPLDLQFDPAGDLLFVSLSSISAVGVYEVLADGGIDPLPASPFLAEGLLQSLRLTSGGSFLYAAGRGLSGAGTVSGFSIFPSGALFELPGSPFPASDPIGLLIDPADELLYLTNNLAGTIGIYELAADGSLTLIDESPLPLANSFPAGMALNTGAFFPGPRILYVTDGGFLSGTSVSAYVIAGDGSISPLPGSPFATGGIGQATGIAFYPLALKVPEIPTLGELGFLALLSTLAGIGIHRLRRG